MPPEVQTLPTLDELRPLMGTLPDNEIAEKAGVKRWEVGAYRRKHGIAGYRGHLFEATVGQAAVAEPVADQTPAAVEPIAAPEPAAPEAAEPAAPEAAEPAASNRRRKPSAIEPYKDVLGTVIDREIAAMAGVTVSAVTQYRLRMGIAAARPAADATPEPAAPKAAPKARAQAASEADTAVARRRRSKLDPYFDLLGKVDDAEIAGLAGVSVDNVRSYRRRHGIETQVEGATAPAEPTREEPQAAPVAAAEPKEATPSRQRRRSKMDPYVDLIGSVSDAEVAAMAGVTTENVRAWRKRHTNRSD